MRSDAPCEFLLRLAHLRGRRFRVAWLGAFLEGLCLSFLILACALLADRTLALLRGAEPLLASRPLVLSMAAALGALSAAFAAALALRASPRGLGFARDVDRRLAAEERVATAAEVAEDGAASSMADAQVADAVRALRSAAGARLYPAPPIGHRALLILPLAVIAWLLTLPPPATDRGIAGARVPSSGRPEPPLADFTAEPRKGSAPLHVRVRSLSAGRIDRCRWDFGDGTAQGEGEEIVHTYREAGTYAVRLEAIGPGGSDVEEKPAAVRVLPAGRVVVDFSAAPRHGPAPLDVQFTSRVEGAVHALRWVYGDGESAHDERSPVHVYRKPGRYTVGLFASGPDGEDREVKEGFIAVGPYEPPEARFTAAPRVGTAPLRVRVEDRSLGAIETRRWDFGDKSPPSAAKNPEHVYEKAGEYSVTLEVSGPAGKDAKTKKNYIVVNEPVPRGRNAGGGGGGRKGDPTADAPKPAAAGGNEKDGGPGGQAKARGSGRAARPGTEPSPVPTLGEPERTPIRPQPKVVDPLKGPGENTKLKVVEISPPSSGAPGDAKPEPYPILYRKYREQAEQAIQGEAVPGSVRELVRRYFEAIRPGE